MNPHKEEEIRKKIRENLERQEQERRRRREEQQQKLERAAEEAEIQRLQREEEQRFYANRPDLIEYINELGEREYLTLEEIREREGYLDYEEKAENVEKMRRLLLVRLGGWLLVLLVALGALIYYLRRDQGTLVVYANVKGAEVILNGQPTGHYTNCTISDIPVGRQLITLRKPHYHMAGDYARYITIRRDKKSVVSLEMEPDSTFLP